MRVLRPFLDRRQPSRKAETITQHQIRRTKTEGWRGGRLKEGGGHEKEKKGQVQVGIERAPRQRDEDNGEDPEEKT